MTFLNTDAPAWSFLRGFEPASLSDWPGKVSSVLFFGGCNLRCPTCHNASFAWDPFATQPLNHSIFLEKIRKNKKWLDGVVLSGGEVTILPEFDQLLRSLSFLGLPVKIDTNGLRPESIQQALKIDHVTTIAVDIKGPWEKYSHLCGGIVGRRRIRACAGRVFRMAAECPEKFMFRCTRVPGLSDEDIRTVQSYLPRGFELSVQKYLHPGA